MKVCVFIDGANFFYGVKSINPKYSDMSFDFEKYINFLIGKDDELLKIFYYNGSLKKLKGLENLFFEQKKFFQRLKNSKKFNVILCKRYKRVNEKVKNSIQLKAMMCI